MPKEPAPLPADDQIMSESDCALILGISVETLKGMRRRGEAPPYFAVTKATVRYSRRRVLDWLESKTVEGAKIRSVGEESER